MRLRATWIVEYDADPAHYETEDPGEMARMDASTDDPIALMANADMVGFTVEPVATTT